MTPIRRALYVERSSIPTYLRNVPNGRRIEYPTDCNGSKFNAHLKASCIRLLVRTDIREGGAYTTVTTRISQVRYKQNTRHQNARSEITEKEVTAIMINILRTVKYTYLIGQRIILISIIYVRQPGHGAFGRKEEIFRI